LEILVFWPGRIHENAISKQTTHVTITHTKTYTQVGMVLWCVFLTPLPGPITPTHHAHRCTFSQVRLLLGVGNAFPRWKPADYPNSRDSQLTRISLTFIANL